MRIIFVGQAPFGAETLEKLIDNQETVVGVITTPEQPNQRQPNPVRLCAEKHDLPLLQPKRLKSPEAVTWVKNLAPDLLVLAFVTSFVPGEMIECARHGGINYHPSLLPKYRGGSAINWAVINGEAETGVSVHFIDEGVDTGPILLQEKVAIEPDDTVKSIYFGKLYPMGIRMMAEAVRLIREGKAVAVEQDESRASFQPVITAADTVIDWNRHTDEIYNLIRGANPSPGASTALNGTTCRLFDAAIGEGTGIPGEIIALNNDSITVATGDGAVNILVLQPVGSKKLPAPEFVEAHQVKCGHIFES